MQKNVQKFKNPLPSGLINNLHIRKLQFKDIDTIVNIEKDSYPDPWSRKMFERGLRLDFSHFFVGEVVSEIASYAELWHIMDEVHLTNITVAKDYRKQGLGTKMLRHVISFSKSLKIKRIFLEVRETNLPAIILYKKFGFNKIGIRKKYYSNSDDAVIMGKCL
ncbi:MAG: ribosomal protein S18-alanine N-acetyltransferase [Elusimicrobia bacterium]|nr:ribosomal protein S18-alanine N-acetyltransferase [Elusimicrobiota bacterium]